MSSYNRPSIRKARLVRVWAKAIDLFFVMTFSIFIFPLGLVIGVFYLSLCDSFQDGQSIGKRLLGLKVVDVETGDPCSYKQSIIRNLPFVFPLCIAVFPFWGWFISGILLFLLAGFELYLLYHLDSGQRLGDVVADTTVMAVPPGTEKIKKAMASWFKEEEALPFARD